MKISHKTLYAIHFLTALAEQANRSKAPLQLREIAERGNLPFKFLEQIALSLKGAGWIRGQRGKEGGYILAVAPSQLTLGAIVRRLEGSSSLLLDGSDDSEIQDVLGGILTRCQAAIDSILDSISLDDLLAEVRTRRVPGFDYAI